MRCAASWPATSTVSMPPRAKVVAREVNTADRLLEYGLPAVPVTTLAPAARACERIRPMNGGSCTHLSQGRTRRPDTADEVGHLARAADHRGGFPAQTLKHGGEVLQRHLDLLGDRPADERPVLKRPWPGSRTPHPSSRAGRATVEPIWKPSRCCCRCTLMNNGRPARGVAALVRHGGGCRPGSKLRPHGEEEPESLEAEGPPDVAAIE
jgi:hypothetical protein